MIVRELVTKLGFRVDTGRLRRFNSSINRTRRNMGGLPGVLRNFSQGFRGLNLGGFSNLLSGMGSSFGGMGSAAAAAAGPIAAVGAAVAATAVIIGRATRAYLEFEEGLRGLRRITLANARTMQRFSDAALNAAETSVFTARDAAQAQVFLAQAGLNTEQVIGALPGTLNLAAAANLGLARATDIATDIMAANGLQVDELNRINDVLVVGARSATTTVQGLAGGFANLGATGRLAGVEIEELAASLTIIQGAGVKGGRAGTFLRNAIDALRTPSSRLSSAMQQVGIDINEYVDVQRGTIKDLPAFIARLRTLSQTDLTTFFRGFAATSRAKRGLEILVASGDNFDRVLGNIRNSAGIAAQSAGVAFEGLGGAIAELRSKMDVSLVRFMQDTGLNKLFEGIVRTLSDVLPKAIRFLGVVLKPIVLVLRVIWSIFSFVLSIIGGIIDVVVRLAQALWEQISRPIEWVLEKLNEWVQAIRDFFSDLVSSDGIIGRIIKTIREFIDKAIKFLGLGDDEEDTGEQEQARREGQERERTMGGAPGGGGGNVYNINAPISVSGAGNPQDVARYIALQIRGLTIEAGGV